MKGDPVPKDGTSSIRSIKRAREELVAAASAVAGGKSQSSEKKKKKKGKDKLDALRSALLGKNKKKKKACDPLPHTFPNSGDEEGGSDDVSSIFTSPTNTCPGAKINESHEKGSSIRNLPMNCGPSLLLKPASAPSAISIAIVLLFSPPLPRLLSSSLNWLTLTALSFRLLRWRRRANRRCTSRRHLRSF